MIRAQRIEYIMQKLKSDGIVSVAELTAAGAVTIVHTAEELLAAL